MKFYLNSNELIGGVLSVVKALPVRAAMHVLEGVLILASEEGIRLKCSDMMLQKECLLPATVEEGGACIVPGKLFTEIVRKLPDAMAEFHINGNTMEIKCGKTKGSIQCIEWEEFPEMIFSGDSYTLEMDRVLCRDMMNQTVFASAQDDSKPILTGVLLELGETIQMVATDAYQFAMRSAPLEKPLSEKSMTIPAKSIVEIARMMDETEQKAVLTFTRTHVKVDIGHTVLIARLLDGDYIKYRQFFPKEHSTRVLIEKAELLESIDRAQLIAREGNNNIVMKFHGNTLHIQANSFVGRMDEEIEVQMNGEDIDISLNPRFCMNILKCIPDEKVYMDFTTSISPCVIRAAVTEGYYYLIVPLRMYTQM